MFTGLVEELGEVNSIFTGVKGAKVQIGCKKLLGMIKIGDSISTNGVCLTVTKLLSSGFEADIMNESLKVTTLKFLKKGDRVNLEKSLTLSSYLGGHLVTGDVDCCGIVKEIVLDGFSKKYRIEIPKEFMKFVVYKGRVAVDGASLTVATVLEDSFIVSLIPHTQENILLGYKKVGELVNIETDLIGKHIEKLLSFHKNSEVKKRIDENFLKKNGFF